MKNITTLGWIGIIGGVIVAIVIANALISARKRRNRNVNGNGNGSSLRPICPSGIYNADGSCYDAALRYTYVQPTIVTPRPTGGHPGGVGVVGGVPRG